MDLPVRHLASCSRSLGILPDVLLLGLCYSILPSLEAQEPGPTFSASTNLVVLDVRVYQRGTGRPVTGLNKRDFEVRDEDNVQELRTVESGSAPLDLALLLDVSGSVVQATRQLSVNARAVADALRRDDLTAVLAFSSHCRVEQPFTSDPDAISEAIRRSVASVTRVDSGTRVFDAISSALKLYRDRADKWRRRAIIVVTDDKERSSKVGWNELATAALEKDVTINGVILLTGEPAGRTMGRVGLPLPIPGLPPVIWDRSTPQYRGKTLSMEPLVDETGGEYLRPIDNHEALLQMLDHLRARYLIAYALPEAQAKAGRHRVEVRLTAETAKRHPDALVRARPYYLYPRTVGCTAAATTGGTT